jgi:hypothetical protein
MAAASARRADKGLGRRAASLVSAAPLTRPCSAPASRPAEGSVQGNGESDTTIFSRPANPEREPE